MPTGPAAIDCRGQRWEVWLHQPAISPALLRTFRGIRFVLHQPPFYVVRVPMSPLEASAFIPIRDYSKQELVAILETNLTLEPRHCLLCQGLLTRHQWAKQTFTAVCENCGEYGLSEDARGALNAGTIDRATAARVIRRRFDQVGKATYTTEQLDGMVEADTRWRTLGDGLDILLVALAREADGYEAIVNLRPEDYVARLGAEGPSGVTELLRIAKGRGFVTSDSQRTITSAGWERVEYHLAALPKARQIFIAMAFHPDTDQAYAAIKRGVEFGGYYAAFRVDKAHYNDKMVISTGECNRLNIHRSVPDEKTLAAVECAGVTAVVGSLEGGDERAGHR